MREEPPQRILLGRIVGAHGIRGEVVIHSYAANAADIGAYGPLSDKSGAKSFKLSGVRSASKGIVARVAGVTDRNGAEALKGTELYVARDKLPATEEGEYYVADLIGMAVIDAEGREIGTIVDAPDYGAGSLLEIRKIGLSQTELVPFTDAFVPHVDMAARRVTVNPIVYSEDDPADEKPSDR